LEEVMTAEEQRTLRFEALFEQNKAFVLADAMRRGASWEDAEDILIDTFFAAWKNLDRIPSPPLPWLVVVARRRLLDHQRSNKRYLRLAARMATVAFSLEQAQLSYGLSDDMAGAQIRQALLKLRDKDREALLLVYLNRFSSAEAGRVMSCTAEAVRHRVSRACWTLRQDMGPGGRKLAIGDAYRLKERTEGRSLGGHD